MSRDEKIWREWWTRNHPFDWYAQEPYGPIPHGLRLHVYYLCRSAFMREERNQATADQPSATLTCEHGNMVGGCVACALRADKSGASE